MAKRKLAAQANNIVQFPRPQLVKVVDRETVNTLADLISDASRGEIIGIAFVAVYKDRSYELGVTGHYGRHATLALGAVTALQSDSLVTSGDLRVQCAPWIASARVLT